MVHALSYPLGGARIIPHGEANQLMFAARKYKGKMPVGKINRLEDLFGEILGVCAAQALTTRYERWRIFCREKGCGNMASGRELTVLKADSVIEGTAAAAEE